MTEDVTKQIFRPAIEQRLWLLRRQSDLDIVKAGGKVIHAVDTSVIVFFTDPHKNAATTSSGKAGYAEVFPHDNVNVIVNLGKSLAHFIFESLGEKHPLLLIPPLAEEVQVVFNAVANRADKHHQRALSNIDDMKSVVASIKKISDEKEAAAILSQKIDKILPVLSGEEGPIAELRRFGLLFNSANIATPEHAIENGKILDPQIAEALTPPNGLYDLINFRELRQLWFERITGDRKSNKRVRMAQAWTDATAIARIQWINERLHTSLDHDEQSRRVVFITGDEGLHRVADKVSYSYGHNVGSFGDIFLRHPRCYLAERGVLESPSLSRNNLEGEKNYREVDGWLDTLLAVCRPRPGEPGFRSKLKELRCASDAKLVEYTSKLSSRPSLVEDFHDKWTDYTRHLAIHKTPKGLELELLNTQQLNVSKQYDDLIQKLETAIDDETFAAWEECFITIADGSGFNILQSGYQTSVGYRARNPPLLDFQTFVEAKKFVRLVLASYQAGQLQAEEWNNALKSLEKEDPSDYTFYIALGVVFATEGVWRIAGILANRALHIADREADGDSKISGREAAYLRAVALRHTARTSSALIQVEEFIERAIRNYHADLDHLCGKSIGVCRFHAELNSVFLTYHLFALLGKRPGRAILPDHVPSLGELIADIDKKLIETERGEEEEEIKNFTLRNLLVNWMMTVFLRIEFENFKPNADDILRNIEKLQKNITDYGSFLPLSFYVDIILNVGVWYMSESLSEKRSVRKNILAKINEAGSSAFVMPYDEARFEFLRKLVN